MPARIVRESREALERMTTESEMNLSDELQNLADRFSAYGFRGSVKLQLTVNIDDRDLGGQSAILDRSINLTFRRW